MRLNQRNPIVRKVFEDEYTEGRGRQGRWKEEHKVTGMSEDELGRQGRTRGTGKQVHDHRQGRIDLQG